MAPSGGIKVEGLRETVKALQEAGAELVDLKDAFGAISKEGAQVVKGFVPTATGRLAGSVRGNRAKDRAVVMAGGARVPYAGAINYGWATRGIEAANFMQDGDRVLEPRAHERLDKAIEDITKKIGS